MLRVARPESRMDRLKGSKLGNLFSRKKQTRHIPDDLCDSQRSPSIEQSAFFDAKVSDASAYENVFKGATPYAVECSKSIQNAIICDVLQVKEVVQVAVNERKVECQASASPITQLDASDTPLAISDDLDALEKARNVHADMLSAISQALARNKQSKLGASFLEAVAQPYNEEAADLDAKAMLESFCVEDVMIPHRDSEPAQKPITKKKDFGEQAARTKGTLLRLTRRHTLNDTPILLPASEEVLERRRYMTTPLPPVPKHLDGLGLTSGQEKSKARVSRRQLRKANYFNDWSSDTRISRRRACSAPLRPENVVVGTSAAISSLGSAANVDHLLGLLLFWYWLAAGRRFFHKASIEKLQAPGSRCLTVEYGIIGFKTGFPNASMDIYRSGSQPGFDPTKPRYTKLPYEDNTFDVVSSLGLAVSVMTKDWPATLAELKRVLKPGGHLEFQAFSTTWINAGPCMFEQQTEYANKLRLDGFCGEIVKTLPHYLDNAGFGNVNLAHLAIPHGWGGRVSSVFSKYYEPLRAYRERQTLCDWTSEQRKQTADESIRHRSSRGLLLIVAIK